MKPQKINTTICKVKRWMCSHSDATLCANKLYSIFCTCSKLLANQCSYLLSRYKMGLNHATPILSFCASFYGY